MKSAPTVGRCVWRERRNFDALKETKTSRNSHSSAAHPSASDPSPRGPRTTARRLLIAVAAAQTAARSVVTPVAVAPMATPVRCGELLCQRDSYARAVSTVVVSCEPRAAAAAAAAPGRKKGKGAAVPPPPLPEWEVVLGDTVLFPEGGGQPSDAGTVGGVQCSRVDNVDGLARHVLSAPLEPGTAVDVVLDWPRREDNMAQHSAQHLLTAIALRKWGYDTTSWGLGDATSFLELGTPEFTPLMMAELEAEANEAVKAGTARDYPRYPEITRDYPRLPKAVKAGTAATPSWHSVARVPRDYPRYPEIPRDYPRLGGRPLVALRRRRQRGPRAGAAKVLEAPAPFRDRARAGRHVRRPRDYPRLPEMSRD